MRLLRLIGVRHEKVDTMQQSLLRELHFCNSGGLVADAKCSLVPIRSKVEKGRLRHPQTKEAKELNPPPQQHNNRNLLGAENCVLGCLGYPELDHSLSRNLDSCTGSRITTHARFPIYQNDLAQPRNREGVLGVLVSQCRHSFQELPRLFLGECNGFRQRCGDL